MGKKAKEHRKKVAKRNKAISDKKRQIQKVYENQLNELIKKEKEAGKFDNPIQETDETPIIGPQI